MENTHKPIIVEQFSDNGEFSHWHLIEPKTGIVLWSSFPEETVAQGQEINPTFSFPDMETLHL